nr:DNA polymerase III subunit delta [candidate division Zixibacteria bacterium]
MTVRRRAVYYGVVSPSELGKELEQGKFRPLYYFFGSEDYRIKEAEKAVIGRFLPKALQVTNHTSLSGSKNKIDDILTELSMIPMLGERQVFTISDVQSFSETDLKRFFSLLDPPDSSRIVIFSTPSAKTPKKTTKLYKFMDTKAAAVEFPKLRGDSSKRRILKALADNNIKIDPKALDIIIELSGGDLGGLTAEINKLIDYIGEGGTITSEIVAEVSSDYQVFKIFELAQVAAVGEYVKAMTIIDFLIRRGENLSSLLFWMGDHFVGLYLAQNRKSPGGGKDMSWKYRGQMELYKNEQLEYIIEQIARADFDLKNNVKPERLIIERLIYNICREYQKNPHA